jgi:hypothetical protein
MPIRLKDTVTGSRGSTGGNPDVHFARNFASHMNSFVNDLLSITEPFGRAAEQGHGDPTEAHYAEFVDQWEAIRKLSDRVGKGDWSTLLETLEEQADRSKFVLMCNAYFERVWMSRSTFWRFPKWFQEGVPRGAQAVLLGRMETLRNDWLLARDELCDVLNVSPERPMLGNGYRWRLSVPHSCATGRGMPDWLTISKVSGNDTRSCGEIRHTAEGYSTVRLLDNPTNNTSLQSFEHALTCLRTMELEDRFTEILDIPY